MHLSQPASEGLPACHNRFHTGIKQLRNIFRGVIRIIFLAAILLGASTGQAAELRLAIGQNLETAMATIRQLGGADITSGQQIIGPQGEHPLTGIYWQFTDYNAIVQMSVQSNTVVRLTYWTVSDFGESKSQGAS